MLAVCAARSTVAAFAASIDERVHIFASSLCVRVHFAPSGRSRRPQLLDLPAQLVNFAPTFIADLLAHHGKRLADASDKIAFQLRESCLMTSPADVMRCVTRCGVEDGVKRDAVGLE
jgi:hypothetical protein